MKENFKKGKMFILLIALVMFLAPLSRVNAVRCGSAFFASKGGYIDFYSTSEYSGYCAPTQRQMFEARGGNESPYNSFKGMEIVEYGKSVRYLFETDSCSGAVGYKQVHDLPTSMIESSLKGIYYCRVAVYFDNPPSKDNFLTVDKKTCLKRVKLGGYLVKQNGFKYLDGTKDNRGYIEVDMKYCTGGSETNSSVSSGTNSSVSSETNSSVSSGTNSSVSYFKITYYGNLATEQHYDDKKSCQSSTGKCGLDRYTNSKVVFSPNEKHFEHGANQKTSTSHVLLYNQYKKTGYTFDGWCTVKQEKFTYSSSKKGCEEKGGKYFAERATVTASQLGVGSGGTAKLYAMWKPKTYKVKYVANVDSQAEFMEYYSNNKQGYNYYGSYDTTNKAYTHGLNYKYGIEYEALGNHYTNKGYNFVGWCTKKVSSSTGVTESNYKNVRTVCTDNGGKYYYYDASNPKKFKSLSSKGGTVNLYAMWEPKTYTINYDSNLPEGTSLSETYTRDNNSFTSGSRVENKVFKHATKHRKGAKFKLIKNRFSVSVPNSTPETTQTSSNGTSVIKPLLAEKNNVKVMQIENAQTYYFAGWCTEPTAVDAECTGTKYENQQEITEPLTPNGGVATLYAMWATDDTKTSSGSEEDIDEATEDGLEAIDGKDDESEENTEANEKEDVLSNESGDVGSDEDTTINPKTGDILIFVVWVVGIAALGYSVYYFRKNRENNVE